VRLVITLLDQQPPLAPADPGEGIPAGELLALQPHGHVALLHRVRHRDLVSVLLGEVPVAARVPHDHAAGPVLTLRDGALEVAVVQGVVLGRHRTTNTGALPGRPVVSRGSGVSRKSRLRRYSRSGRSSLISSRLSFQLASPVSSRRYPSVGTSTGTRPHLQQASTAHDRRGGGYHGSALREVAHETMGGALV